MDIYVDEATKPAAIKCDNIIGLTNVNMYSRTSIVLHYIPTKALVGHPRILTNSDIKQSKQHYDSRWSYEIG